MLAEGSLMSWQAEGGSHTSGPPPRRRGCTDRRGVGLVSELSALVRTLPASGSDSGRLTIEILACGASQVRPSGSDCGRSTCGVIPEPSG